MDTAQFSLNVKGLKQIIDKSKHWVLVPHIHPDGDAIGSCLGLSLFLKAMGKTVTLISPDDAPDNLSFLNGFSDFMIADKNMALAKNLFLEVDSIAFLDFNKAERCGKISEWIEESDAQMVMIDHHPYPEFKNVLQISEPTLSSTCELVTRIISEMDLMHKLNQEAATCLYAGILTDTGGFSHNSSRPELFRIVADLLDKGIDKDFIHNEILHQQSASRMKLMGFCLNEKLMLLEDLSTAIISLSQDELDRFDYKKGDTEGFVNLPLSIKGIVLSILVMERDGETRMSFRSKGDFPANKVASMHFAGGGHRNAAGGRSELTVESTVAKLLKVLPEYTSFL